MDRQNDTDNPAPATQQCVQSCDEGLKPRVISAASTDAIGSRSFRCNAVKIASASLQKRKKKKKKARATVKKNNNKKTTHTQPF